MIKFHDIKQQLLFWYGTIILILLLLFSVVLYQSVKQQKIKLIDTQLQAVWSDIDHDLSNKIKNNKFCFDETQEFHLKNLYIELIEYNKIIYQSNFYDKTSSNIRRYMKKSFKEPNIMLTVATTVEDKISHSLQSLLSSLYLLIPIVFVISLTIGYALIYYSFKPVRSIIDQVKNRDIYDHSVRITKIESKDEIQQLIDTFNTMLDSIESSYEKIKRFSNDASHELKTPLTVIRGEIELGLRKNRSNNEYKEILDNVLEETKQLQHLIDSLLFLASHNQQQIQAKFVNVQLDELLLEIIQEKQPLMNNKNIQLKITTFEESRIFGSYFLLKIAFGNILENSIKYSHNNSNIEIQSNSNSIIIKDYGIGIKAKDIPYLFDSFYRSDKARGRTGHGLGLSIVKTIFDLHNIDITIQSIYGIYTQVTVKLDKY